MDIQEASNLFGQIEGGAEQLKETESKKDLIELLYSIEADIFDLQDELKAIQADNSARIKRLEDP